MTTELPELPFSPYLYTELTSPTERVSNTMYTADQMRAYGQECAKLERERCAAICDLVEVTQEIDHGAANTGGAAACAEAIRQVAPS